MRLSNFKISWHMVVFPILAIAFSGWFLKKYFEDKGKEIIVLFADAKSIQSEKTRLFYRGVPIGIVKEITISSDGTRAVCHISLQKESGKFAVEGSKFYLVTPKLGLEGISGLETLISGSYIAIEPGNLENDIKSEFQGEMSKISVEPEENTTLYIVETDHAESVSPGSSIFYRGVTIGMIGEVILSKSSKTDLINLNIRNRYTRLVRVNTVFWKKQGIKADLGLFGSKIKINSLETILRGGIEIATPNQAGIRAKAGHRFNLSSEEPKELEKEKWVPDLSLQ